jgi:hypothetical protein
VSGSSLSSVILARLEREQRERQQQQRERDRILQEELKRRKWRP